MATASKIVVKGIKYDIRDDYLREEIEKFFNDNFIDFSYYDCVELYYHFIADEIIALLNYYQQ